MSIVHICSTDGDYSGIKEIKSPNWNGVCYDLPRNNVSGIKHLEHGNRPAVYNLMDDSQENVYIGQTDTLSQRITAHNTDFIWDRVIAIVPISDLFNVAHMQYLEFLLSERAVECGRVELVSRGNNRPQIGSHFVNEIKKFQEEVENILPLIGINFYKLKPEGGEEDQLFCKGPEADAQGFYNSDGSFVVKKGSKIKAKTSPGSIGYSFEKKRDSLLKEGVLKEIEDSYELKKDVIFNSPSGAAGFVLGRSSNGYQDWKNLEGVPLSKILNKQKD